MARSGNKNWYENFWIMLPIAVLNHLIPDPIPFIDELSIDFYVLYLADKKFKINIIGPLIRDLKGGKLL